MSTLPAGCTSSQLGRVRQTVRPLGKGSDGDFRYADDFRLVNVSGKACSLAGWMGLTMYGDDTAVYCPDADGVDPCHGRPKSKDDPVEERVVDTGSKSPVVLPPGHAASFSVDYEGVICLHHPYRLVLRVPQDATHPLNVVGTPICVTHPVVEVSPFA